MRRVHLAGAVGQVVGLVHQKQIVAAGFKKAFEADHRVKEIIVIAHDYIAPKREVQPQFEGADLKPRCKLFQQGAGEFVFIQRLPQHVPDAVVIAAGIGAGVRRALALFQQAGFVFGGKGDAFEREPRLRGAQGGEGLLGGGAGGGAGGEVKNALAPALAHGFERGKQGAHGFADAGGRLAEQAPAVPEGTVSGRRHGPLAAPVLVKGKGQGLQAGGPGPGPCGGPLCPGGIFGQERLHKGIQLGRGKAPRETDDLFFIHLEIGEPHRHFGKAVLGGIDCRVYLPLSPVHRLHILGDLLGRDGDGLDLVHGDEAVRGENAVGPAVDEIIDPGCAVFLFEIYFGLVPRARGFLQAAVDARALGGPVKAGKSAVDAAGLEQKLHQLAHRQMHLFQTRPPPLLDVFALLYHITWQAKSKR